MEPEEVDDNLLNNSLKGLVYFTGLDLGGSNPLHNAIFNAFTEPKRERAVQLNYKMLSADNELFHSRTTSHQQLERAGREPALRSPFRGIIKRKWPQKYLEQRPALIVAFVDLDWDSPAWFEKRTECESKITTLRQTIGQREIKLVLVLIQRQKTGADDSVAAEKALEICQHCRISSRHLYVFPLLPDSKATFECATRLEMAFHEITQEAYQLCFKRIRARNVPNNDPQVLIRQQFKLAFISELREDRHSALRYYRQAYQIAAELEIADVDNFELLTVAGLLNYKICELNFLLNSPVESLNQFRKHSTNFFNREPGVYPSRELAAIEFLWWKSQQCRIFAELFNRAVSNGLAAYPAQNPGRFLEEAASHCKRSNALVRQLRSGLAQQQTAAANQQRRTPPVVGVDQLIDLKAPTLFFGQRPWRSLSMTANNSRASSEPIARSTGLAPLAGNPHLVEHAAKQLLEKNLHENYAQSIQLFSSAITQFKRYRCERFATLAYMDMADELMASRQFPQALQIFRHVVVELGSSSFRPLLRDALTKMVNAAFLVCNLNEWIWAMSQLLHIEMAEAGGRERSGSTLAEEIHEDTWLDEAQRFLSGNARLPFLVPQKELLWIPTTEEIDSVRQQWHHQLAGQQFQMDLSRFGKNCPIECQFSFLLPANGQQAKDFHHGSAGANESVMPSVRAGEPIPVQVILRSHCRIPLTFTNSSLLIEQNSASGKTLLTLEDWIVGSGGKRNGPILLPVNGRNARTSIFFLLNPSFGQALAGEQLQGFNRSLSPTANKPMELHFFIRRFSVGSSNGTFFWDAEPPTAVVVDPNNSLSTEVRMPKQMTELDWVTKIKVLPQLKKLHITGPPAGNIQMFTDESVGIPFTLQNNSNGSDGQEVGEAALKSVRVLCQKVYREEDPLGHRRSGPFIQHLLSPPASHQRRSMDLQQEMMGLGHTLVPVFNQEVATFLGQGESTDFCVRLQSKLDNCVSLQIQICSLLQNGEPAEWVEDFPIECCEPFQSEVAICCENGEQAKCLVYGQRYRVQVDIRPAQQVSVSSVKWKLNTPSVGICAEQPLSAILLEQLKSLTMLTTNGLAKNKPDSIREEIWIEIPAQSPTIPAAAETETQLTLGEATVEWSSANSCESVRSLLPLGQLPLISSPIAIQADLLPSSSPSPTNNNNMDDDEWGTIPQVGQPFAVRFTLWNSCAAGTETLLPVQIAFEQVDGLIFSGTKESFLTLLPDGGRHSFVQTFVPLCPGQLAFPKPRIKCISTLPDRPTVDLSSEELERLNRQIALHAFSALPASIFVMP